MNNLWSENRYVNTTINILLVMLGMNIFHYGQLLLPIICLIIFVDNKFKFKVTNNKIFVILCLFSISFFVFSYKFGFYSTMGFTIPMAYYIGSNILEPDEEKIKHVIYLLAFGMSIYLLLNIIYELNKLGVHQFLHKIGRYDIWLNDKIASTAIASYAIIPLSLSTYIIFEEKNKIIRFIGLGFILLIIFYCIALSRRTPLVMIVITFAITLLYDAFILKKEKYKKYLLNSLITILVFVLIAYFLYVTNIFDLRNSYNIITVFLNKGLKSDRFVIILWGSKYLLMYPFGGQYISDIIGYQFHDLLFDIYDYAGVIPCILMLSFVIYTIVEFIRLYGSKRISNLYKPLLICTMVSIGLMMTMEPIITGCSLFLICSVIIVTSIDSLLKKED